VDRTWAWPEALSIPKFTPTGPVKSAEISLLWL